MLKKFSLATAYIVISLVGLSSAGAQAALDGVLSVESSDPGVLAVTPMEGGLFRVDFVGAGQASLRVSGDADLGDGVRMISQEYGFEIYDQHSEADHFDLAIVERHPRDEAESSGSVDVAQATAGA